MSITIAVDAMGGDVGPAATVAGSAWLLEELPDLNVVFTGRRPEIEAILDDAGYSSSRVSIVDASEVVGMDEPPAQALRNKKDSSMRVALNLVREGRAEACVSAGNTGALMATARFVLKTLPGIERPAIITALPRISGHVHVLDLGANVDSPPRLLFEFAVMGSVLVTAIEDKPNPTVGLLNIGVEDIKGNNTIREAAELLRKSKLNYAGFVEGDHIYTGTVDVVVCDGFVGNVALKASEGLAQMIARIYRDEFNRNVLTRIAGLAAMPVMRALSKRVDHRRYNGATFLGLNGTVIKSHGSADKLAFAHALKEAYKEAQQKVPTKISRAIGPMLEQVDLDPASFQQ